MNTLLLMLSSSVAWISNSVTRLETWCRYMRYVDIDVSEMNTIDSDVAIIQFLPPPHGALRPSNIIHSRGGVGGRPGRR